MAQRALKADRRISEEEALRLVVEGTVSTTGVDFFRALVKNLCEVLDTAGAWITELLPGQRRLRSLAFWLNGEYVSHYEYDIEGTPCQPVIESMSLAHFPDRVIELFPDDPDLPGLDAVSYMGVPLLDTDGELLGHLAVLDTRPMPAQPRLIDVFEIFAERAAAEFRRLRAEQRALAREEQLTRLLDGAMDAIVVFDSDLAVIRTNPAAERVFGWPADDILGRDVRTLLDRESSRLVSQQARTLEGCFDADRQHWFPHDLGALRRDGSSFPAEATLSCFESGGTVFHTMILRNVDERRQAENRIRILTDEAEYLRDVVREASGSDDIVGRSPPMTRLYVAMAKVAATDTTVLVLGETGTGKELIARSIHRSSPRRDGPLVRVNCAAVPGTLMESEFFGHEKGAFTGAVSRREGRFALADGGSILLDEVGELPLDLQAKLLRVLQEGEFEPLGSTSTRTVDVRVVAATNRDLQRMVSEGAFREDLYYRLNVFPLEVPPLRDRDGDIGVLAGVFAERFAVRMGRRVEPLSEDDVRRLSAYHWPGNVRELQNVIERAIILSPGTTIDIASAMPTAAADILAHHAAPAGGSPPPILTAAEFQVAERANILRALEARSWKVAGEKGAARLLGLPASTLSSRMRALGIRRPARP
jgi:PAS domain S-box-containing protein